jgi:hypothetical protein
MGVLGLTNARSFVNFFWRRDFDFQEAVVEFPVAVGAESDQIFDAADDGDRGIVGKVADGADVADFDVFVVAAVVTDAGAVGLPVDLPCDSSQCGADLIFRVGLDFTYRSFSPVYVVRIAFFTRDFPTVNSSAAVFAVFLPLGIPFVIVGCSA